MFERNSDIMNSSMPICLKRKVFDQCILPAITYASETWTLTAKMENKLEAAQRNMERSMLGITMRDRKTHEWIREKTKVQDILKTIKLGKWTWAGHVARRTDGRWTIAVTEWTPRTGKRSQGRPYKRWRDDIDNLSTGGRLPGQNIQGTENTGKNMLRPSSCSGVTTADMMMMMIYIYIQDNNTDQVHKVNSAQHYSGANLI